MKSGASTCAQCSTGCSACSGTTTTCTACNIGYYLVGSTCQPCNSNCATCSGSGTNCTSCAANMGVVGGACVTCDASCSSCSGSATNCTGCPGSLTLSSTGKCFSCDTTCAFGVCSENSSNCTSGCNAGYYTDYQMDSNGQVFTPCKACPAHCTSCKSGTDCSSNCETGYFWYPPGNECRNTAPEFPDGRNIGIIAGIGGVAFIGLLIVAVKVAKTANIANARFLAAQAGQVGAAPSGDQSLVMGPPGITGNSASIYPSQQFNPYPTNDPGVMPLINMSKSPDLPPNFA